MNPLLRLSILVLALAGCASSQTATDADKKPPEGDPKVTAAGPGSPASFAQVLVDLDRRVDRYALLASQSGDDARAERALLGPALRAVVAQNKEALLAAAANEKEPERRRVAAKALAFGDEAAVPVLQRCVVVKDDVRLVVAASYALAQLRSPSTDPEPLLAAVADKDPMVRGNALLALWHVFDAKRAVGASPLDPVRQEQALPILEVALFDQADPVVRANAAAAVGALGDPRAVDSLINLLADEHPLVRTQTAVALGRIGDVKAVPALVTIIEKTPAGTPRKAVTLALQTIMEKAGHRVPDTLGDSQRLWEAFVREKLTVEKK